MPEQTTPAAPAPSADKADAESNKALAIVGYIIPILFFIPLINESSKNSPFAKFHANQQLVLLIAAFIVQVVGVVIPILFAMLVTLSVLAPWEIGDPANPLSTPEHIKPEWYFLPSYQLLKYFEGPYGAVIGVLACSLPFLLLLLWPFLDRGKERHPRKRPLAVGFGLVGLLAALFLGWLGHISETDRSFFGKRYHIDLLGRPHRIQESKEASEATGHDP